MLYYIVVAKITYYILAKQIPFIKPTVNPISGFFLGNLKELNKQKNPEIFSKWQKQVNAPIYGISMAFSPRVVVFDRDLYKYIGMSPDAINFEKTPETVFILKFLENGILLQERQQHAAIRKELLPVFNLENIKKMYPQFIDGANKLVDKMRTVDHENYKMAIDLQSCTLDIISKTAFDYDMNSLGASSEITKSFESLLVVVKFGKFLLLQAAFPIVATITRYFRFSVNEKLASARQLIDTMIKKRLESSGTKSDLLSKCLEVLKISKSEPEKLIELRQQLLTFLFAGHETTSNGLAWAIYILCQHQSIQEKLRIEIGKESPSWEFVQNNKYLDKVINETLRLYSPVNAIVRHNTKAFTFKGIYFPKYTRFFLPIQGRHLHSEIYSNPLEFNPERWENPPKDTFDHIPFWLGNRGCLGKTFAVTEFKAILCILLQNFKFTMDKSILVERNLTVTQKPSKLVVNFTEIQ